ncbi:hypothetical protein [Phormidesmis priestleyi]
MQKRSPEYALGLFFLELLVLAGSIIQLTLLLRVRDRKTEADYY